MSLAQTFKNIANAIREKGVTGTMTPSQMASKVDEISGGGEDLSTQIVDGSISGDYVNDRVTSIGLYTFSYCNSLTSVSFPNATTIGMNAFLSCSSLTSVSLPNVTGNIMRVFPSCTNLTRVNIPNITSFTGGWSLMGCGSLSLIDFRDRTVSTIPTLSGDFSYIHSEYKIVVPDDMYDDWIVATNWVAYADHIVKASEYTEE